MCKEKRMKNSGESNFRYMLCSVSLTSPWVELI